MTHGKKKIRFALGISGALFGAGGLLLACGGDDTTVGIGGTDAAADGTIVTGDGGGDAGDATLDGTSPTDGGGDGSSDAADAADADNSAALLAYAHNLATAYCTNLQTRCSTFDAGAGTDAGTVDLTYCENSLISGGTTILEDSTLGILFPNALGHGDITFDPVLAQRCIGEVQNLDLTNVQSANYKQIVTDCFAVSHGTAPVNSPCYASLECAAGNWCELGLNDAGTPDAGDAGDGAAPVPPPTGLCVPLLAAGASCMNPAVVTQTNNYQFSGVSCSYLGSSSNGAFCDSFNSATCIQGLLDIDASCPTDPSCQSGICELDPAGDNAFCKAATNLLITAQSCTLYSPTP